MHKTHRLSASNLEVMKLLELPNRKMNDEFIRQWMKAIIVSIDAYIQNTKGQMTSDSNEIRCSHFFRLRG